MRSLMEGERVAQGNSTFRVFVSPLESRIIPMKTPDLFDSEIPTQLSATSKPGGLKKPGRIGWFYGSFDLR
jgi:hypothetical protein